MTDRKHVEEERTHDSGKRNSDHGVGSDTHKLPPSEQDHSEDADYRDADGRYIDPAEAVMNSNPMLSPPIHFTH
jgi:hypothetical protein